MFMEHAQGHYGGQGAYYGADPSAAAAAAAAAGGHAWPGVAAPPDEDEYEPVEHSTAVDVEKLNRELFERNQVRRPFFFSKN